MKKELAKTKKTEGNESLSQLQLLGWASFKSAVKNSSNYSRHIHHCIQCDCVMICSDKTCKDSCVSCPDCYGKPEVVFEKDFSTASHLKLRVCGTNTVNPQNQMENSISGNQSRLECSKKSDRPQGGN